MEDQEPKFTPGILEDRTPGGIVILSPKLVGKLKARRDAEESPKPEKEPNTGTTS